jgi:tetratricopeptide (TPR) repeat protein
MALNQEAHELPAEKQRQALDFMSEAPEELREKLSPMWKFCFVQWHIYDAGLEMIDKSKPLNECFTDDALLSDIESLQGLFDSGDLESATTTEKWTWKMLEAYPEPEQADTWSKAANIPMVKVGREERREGVSAFEGARYDKAYWHFWQGLKLIARAPVVQSGALAKLRCDLYKNKAAAALKLKMGRIALEAASAAVAIDSLDEKAWYRKAGALNMLGEEAEAKKAMKRAGLDELATGGAAASEMLALTSGQPAVQPGGKINMGAVEPDEIVPHSNMEELDPYLYWKLEEMVFIEHGVDSLAAVDLVMQIQSELPGMPIPQSLVFDCPTVAEAVEMLAARMNGGEDPELQKRLLNTIWRAMAKALGRDPVKSSLDGHSQPDAWPRSYTEEDAIEILTKLKAIYDADSWVQTTRSLARRVAFEHRSFLVNLRPKALQVQAAILEEYGFEPDAEGIRKLECAIVNVARRSSKVADVLTSVRVALHGGVNGMWAISGMENHDGELWADSHSMQSRVSFTKEDPFGPGRVNTNSTYSELIGVGA